MSGERFANYHLAVYGLFLAGGATVRVDTEDVAAICWKLAPARFSWKKYRNFPDKDIVRTALSDAKKSKNGALVDGTGDERWLLTTKGLKWIGQHEPDLQQINSGPTRSSVDQARDSALQRVRAHSVFELWRSGVARPVRPYEAADVVELTADAPRDAVLQSLEALANSAILARDSKVQEFAIWLRDGIKRSQG